MLEFSNFVHVLLLLCQIFCYYAQLCSSWKGKLLCSKLCQHNVPRPAWTPLHGVHRSRRLFVYTESARPSGKLSRWPLTIQEMDITIINKHKAGKQNTNADTLSRNPGETSAVGTVNADSESSLVTDVCQLKEEQDRGPNLAVMLLSLT